MGCLSAYLVSSTSIQKLFCGSCSAFKWSFDEVVGKTVVFPSYSLAILWLLPLLLNYKLLWLLLIFSVSPVIFRSITVVDLGVIFSVFVLIGIFTTSNQDQCFSLVLESFKLFCFLILLLSHFLYFSIWYFSYELLDHFTVSHLSTVLFLYFFILLYTNFLYYFLQACPLAHEFLFHLCLIW